MKTFLRKRIFMVLSVRQLIRVPSFTWQAIATTTELFSSKLNTFFQRYKNALYTCFVFYTEGFQEEVCYLIIYLFTFILCECTWLDGCRIWVR